MRKRVKEKLTVKFKKGYNLHLDQIYDVQGLDNGNWWDHSGIDESEEIIITRDVHFTITIYET